MLTSFDLISPAIFIFEPLCDKSNDLSLLPAKAQISLIIIRVFAICRKKAAVLSYLLNAEQNLIRLRSFCRAQRPDRWLCRAAAHDSRKICGGIQPMYISSFNPSVIKPANVLIYPLCRLDSDGNELVSEIGSCIGNCNGSSTSEDRMARLFAVSM